MTTSSANDASLHQRILDTADEAGAEAVAVAYHDYATRTEWSVNGDEPFHAASTIKIAVLAALYAEIDRSDLSPLHRLHVRNRFLSAADGTPFRVTPERDANGHVHRRIGHTMRFHELARHMIVTSSNLATNLLIDFLGVETCREVMHEIGAFGVELRRGVEDELAHDEGIDNETTAEGLRALLRAIHERRIHTEDSREAMLEILHAQEFRRGIPAGLPDDAAVAHKTGEISTIAHDAAIVTLPDRQPYILVVLTRWAPGEGDRKATIARISQLIYAHLPPEAGSRRDDEVEEDG